MFISFSDIPGHHNLFLDYLYEFENVEGFYPWNFRDIESYGRLFEAVSSDTKRNREGLFRVLEQQYSKVKISSLTSRNIEALREKNTIAVVTGQQLGLMGGPLYTFYKIITAIKLCSYLRDNFDDYTFVPVFWLEGNDHDFEEVKSFNILDQAGEIKTIGYDDGLEAEINRGSVADIQFNENIATVFESLGKDLRESEFKEALLKLLRYCYYKGATFEESFRSLLTELFDDYGLVIFSPQQKEAKELLRPLFLKELKEFRKHTDMVINRSAEVEELYHAQVKVKPVNLFFQEQGGRYLVEPDEEGFSLKGKRKKFSLEEIIEIAENNPELFSPNVLLRPICQDYLFPTGAYIGGPGEISYFSQVMPLYEAYSLNAPVIFPRASATIIETPVKRVMEKLDLDYSDIFNEEKLLTKRVIDQVSDIDSAELFKNSEKEIIAVFNKIDVELSKIDKTLTDVVEKTLNRNLQGLQVLKEKAIKADERRHETALRQVNKLRMSIFPAGSLQEREINFTYFANKYGPELIKWMFNEISIFKFEHQIMEMPGRK